MKERSSFGRVAAILFLLAFVAVLGFRVYDGLSEKITTMEATLVKVEDILSVDGTFIRDQVVILGKGDDAEYMVSNGEKVSVGQGVVMTRQCDSETPVCGDGAAFPQGLNDRSAVWAFL